MTDEYLDRSSLVARMKYYEEHTMEGSGEHYAYSTALREIRNAPAADVAPVVRCKDCEFSRELTKTEKKIWRDECRACESPEASQDGYMIVFPEHFCSYGRRKEQCD